MELKNNQNKANNANNVKNEIRNCNYIRNNCHKNLSSKIKVKHKRRKFSSNKDSPNEDINFLGLKKYTNKSSISFITKEKKRFDFINCSKFNSINNK